jgi:hypothetical protein
MPPPLPSSSEDNNSDDDDDLEESAHSSLNPFTGHPCNEWYVRRSIKKNPGRYYWVNRETGEEQWECPVVGFSIPPDVDVTNSSEEFEGFVSGALFDNIQVSHSNDS